MHFLMVIQINLEERGKKFMYKKFKELLVDTMKESMEDQKRKLEDRLFNGWAPMNKLMTLLFLESK